MADCTYRYWDSAISPFIGKTYGTLSSTASPWAPTVLNDLDFYTGAITADPVNGTERKWKKVPFSIGKFDATQRTLLLQWLERKHAVRPAEAVLAIMGSSLVPGAWFSDSLDAQGQTVVPYLNYAGTQMYADGMDVFAPMVTHHTSFQDPQARLASAYGERYGDIDTRRVVAMFQHIKALGYSRIHLTGTSLGGWLSVLAAQVLVGDPVLGMSLSFEGWYSTQKYVENDQSKLFASGWEASFSRKGSYLDFVNFPPDAYFSYGSCNAPAYQPDYSKLPSSRVILFDGAHEFKYEVFQSVLARWRVDNGLSVPPPPPVLPINDAFTKIYLPLISDIVDSPVGTTAHVFTASGGAAVSGGALQAGSNGLTAFISTPDAADINLGSQDFTLEGIWRFASVSADSSAGENLMSQRVGSGFSWSVDHYNGAWEFNYSLNGVALLSLGWAASISANTDYAIKLSRSGSFMTLSVNGTSLGSKSISGTIFDSAGLLRIGGDGVNSGGTNGSVRAVALAIGIAR